MFSLRSAGRTGGILSNPRKKVRISIENSVTGQSSTSMKHALNYVKRKRAIWVKKHEVIRFLPSKQHSAVAKCARKPQERGRFYEAGNDTLAKPYQVRGAGAVGDIDRLYTLGILGDWAYRMAVLRMPNQNANNNGIQRRGIA
jgi:hypothetical protein